jgi:hypothetical protein
LQLTAGTATKKCPFAFNEGQAPRLFRHIRFVMVAASHKNDASPYGKVSYNAECIAARFGQSY